LETIPSPRLGFLRGDFLANHLASTDNSTKQPKDRTHSNKNYQYIKRALINNNTIEQAKIYDRQS